MSTLKIDADALFRAVTAASHKLLAYHLDLQTGAVISRTMRPDEVADAPTGPSVKPLPKLGGDLTPKKDAAPFGPPPVKLEKKLFADDDGPKKPAFASEFWKRGQGKKADPFGADGFRSVSGTKKLAEIFGEKEPRQRTDPAPAPAPAPAAPAAPATEAAPDEARWPRIPVAGAAQELAWVRDFARDFGDPEIREEILKALQAHSPRPSFERVLRKYQRMNQQWDIYFRKQALAAAEAWLATLGVPWELVEPEQHRA